MGWRDLQYRVLANTTHRQAAKPVLTGVRVSGLSALWGVLKGLQGHIWYSSQNSMTSAKTWGNINCTPNRDSLKLPEQHASMVSEAKETSRAGSCHPLKGKQGDLKSKCGGSWNWRGTNSSGKTGKIQIQKNIIFLIIVLGFEYVNCGERCTRWRSVAFLYFM